MIANAATNERCDGHPTPSSPGLSRGPQAAEFRDFVPPGVAGPGPAVTEQKGVPNESLVASVGMITDIAWRSVLACCLALSLAGCDLSTSDMTPVRPPIGGRHIDASVTVMDVAGQREDNNFGGPVFIANDEFKETLSRTIDKSGLFRRVEGRGGTYMLYAKIVNQGQDPPRLLDHHGSITVQYLFRRASDEKPVWDKTFTSEFNPSTLSGVTPAVKAREGSVRENLAAFLKAVAETWPH